MFQASGALQNIFPIMFNDSKDKDMNKVMDAIMEMMDKSIECFDQASKILDTQTRANPKLNKDCKAYLHNHRTYITALIEWSITSKRYNLQQYMQKDGSILLNL